MMCKTHFAVGLATALAVMRPDTFGECTEAVVAGTVGGMLADIDLLHGEGRATTLAGHLFVPITATAALLTDGIFGWGICRSFLEDAPRSVIGLLVFVLLCTIGFFSPHRSFTHSLLGGTACTAAVWLMYPPLTLGFAAAYASHLLLDVVNKRGIRLLFPLKRGICLNLCYADRLANTVCMDVGFVLAGVLLTVGILQSLS